VLVGLNRRALTLAALGGALVVALWSPLPAGADTTFTVTSAADTGGSTCGSDCTLRQAINAANAAGGQDTIRFAISGSSEIDLASELPAVSDPAGLTIDGAGATNVTINGGNAVRVISVDQGAGLTLADLSIENGNAGTGNGGAIFNQAGTVTVSDATLSGNTSGASGGAIFNNGGVVTVSGSTFTANRAASGAGGGILNTADGGLAVTNSTFAGNAAGSGGAILNTGGAGVVVSYSTLFQNRANQGGGGGILNDPSGGTATVRATILAGSPPGQGGSCSGTIADGGYDIDDGTTCGELRIVTERGNVLFGKQPQHHVVQHGGLRHFTRQALRQMRHNNFQISFAVTDVESQRRIVEDRFFYKEDASILSAAFQQMLRTLIHEIPTKM